MNITALLIGLISSAVGSLGFALIFRVRPKYLVPASFGGMLGFAVYFLFDMLGFHIFATNFLAALAAAIFSEICARVLKAPAVVFSIPCIIPLVPGSLLYYTMSHLLDGKYTEAFSYLTKTLLTALGIAGGLIVVSVLVSVGTHIRLQHLTKKREKTDEKA